MKYTNKIYEDYLEDNDDLADEEVTQAYKQMNIAIESYICAVVGESWKNGFEHAVKLMSGGGKDV